MTRASPRPRNSATAPVDELASQSVPYTDPARQIREQVAQALRADARAVSLLV